MVTVVIRRPALADSAFNCGALARPCRRRSERAESRQADGPERHQHEHERAAESGETPVGCLLFAIFRCPESLSHFPLLHERQWIVDFLHDHQALRGDAPDHAVQQPIVHVRRERLAVWS